MSGWLAVGAAMVMGWSLWRLMRGVSAVGVLPAVLTAGIVATATWMAALDLAGVRWSATTLLLPAPVLATAVLLRRREASRSPAGSPELASWPAAAVALPHALAIALIPSFGWDFRYIWGVKAKIFSAAGAHDLAMLAWPAAVHPDYPPLWSDLLAFSVNLGTPPAPASAAWQATLCIALAVACWYAAARAPLRLRLLAAAVGGWCPVVFRPDRSGYAEPLLAFLACVALAALAEAGRGGARSTALVAGAVAALAITKNEGTALAFGIALGTLRVLGLRRSLPLMLAGTCAAGGWQLALLGHGIGGSEFSPSLSGVLRHLAEMPAATAAAFAPIHGVLLAAWGCALLGLRGRPLVGVRTALVVWAAAVAGAYLTTTSDLTWHLANSLDRVLAAPLPAVVAVALAATAGEPPSPPR